MKLYKITASWCLSCIYMNEIFDNVTTKNKINFDIIPLDYDLDMEKIEPLNVGDILPVYILYKDGKEIDRLIGENSEKKLTEFFKVNGGLDK